MDRQAAAGDGLPLWDCHHHRHLHLLHLTTSSTSTSASLPLQEKGTDIFRMKGVLAMKGCDDKYVYQGVHMLFTGEALEPWGDAPRVNRLVFIGRNLDRDALLASFESCLDETQA